MAAGRIARPRQRDALVAGLLLLLSELSLLVPMEDGEFHPAWRLTAATACVALAWRRAAPVAAVSCFAGVLLAEAVLATPSEGVWALLGTLIAAFSVCAYARLSRAVGALLVLTGSLMLCDRIASGGWFEDVDFLAVLIGCAAVAGRSALRRREQVVAHRELAERLRAQQDALAAAAVADERSRLARDLHDVVAHHVSVMVLQAAAAQALDDDPERRGAAVRAVQETGRETLDELRRVLDVLRPGEADPVEAPGLASVGRLAERARAAGTSVEMAVEADLALPAGVDLAVYRVLQEGVTNALRHAPGSTVRLDVRQEGEDVVAVCANTAAQGPAAGTGGAGAGLAGLAERVALYGGSLSAGPRAEGGFEVRARIPVIGSTAAAARLGAVP